ncbi:MAG TPA: T9SS type A sorting domain-containing protein [Candidatus Marinimicrobia bacterium]|nr:T9SS type A sorting domain-containing protein [Candidatus Neomarinimicrobiota bacterium]
MDLDNISTFYVGTKAAFTPATQNSTATLLVDDISAFLVSITSTHLDDNFEGYANNSALGAKWDMVWSSKNTVNMSRNLDVINGVNASQAMKLEITVESETTPSADPDLGVNWEPCVYGITGFFTASEHQTDMTGYQGVKVWLMPGANTGNEDFYFKLNLIEDEANGSEEKWMSPKVYLNTLNPNGEYIYFAFDEFYQYYTNSTESMELDKIKLSYLFLAYDNIVTLNSTASVMVDDITYINELAIDSGENIVPHRFNLSQNYPNPFNPTTTINYELAYASDVQLIVYNIVGREIIKLVDNRENAGTHNIKWNGRDKYGVEMASGVYIYQLKSGNNSTSRKLLLIK